MSNRSTYIVFRSGDIQPLFTVNVKGYAIVMFFRSIVAYGVSHQGLSLSPRLQDVATECSIIIDNQEMPAKNNKCTYYERSVCMDFLARGLECKIVSLGTEQTNSLLLSAFYMH